jgi:hypothetical protein
MAKQFSGNGLAWSATQFSSSARTVIVVIATAALDAVNKPAANSGDAPTDGTNRVSKGASIIVIVSGNTGVAVKHKLA